MIIIRMLECQNLNLIQQAKNFKILFTNNAKTTHIDC